MGGFVTLLSGNTELTSTNSPVALIVEQLTLYEGCNSAPTFSIKFSVPENKKLSQYLDKLTLKINTPDIVKTIDIAVTAYDLDSIVGVQMKAEQWFVKRCRPLSTSLKNSLNMLKLGTVNNLVDLNYDKSFYQINESDWECGKRLMNLCGESNYWSKSSSGLSVFSAIPSNSQTEIVAGVGYSYSLDCSRSRCPAWDSTKDSRNNISYGKSIIPVSPLVKYPQSGILSSQVRILKYGGWSGAKLVKSYTVKPNLKVGETVKFTDIVDAPNIFIVTNIATTINQPNTNYTVTFENDRKWNYNNLS